MEFITEIIITIVGGSISAFVLLLTHHWKIKQEIEIHRQNELFDKKQNEYRILLKLILKLIDQSHLVGTKTNWKIARYVYNEVMLIGSPEVIKATNELIINSELEGEKLHNAIKDLWKAIRNDLYRISIPESDMHIISPSPETLAILNIYHKNSEKFSQMGLTFIDDLATMNVEEVQKKTSISIEELTKIKNMAENEIQNEKDLKKFLE